MRPHSRITGLCAVGILVAGLLILLYPMPDSSDDVPVARVPRKTPQSMVVPVVIPTGDAREGLDRDIPKVKEPFSIGGAIVDTHGHPVAGVKVVLYEEAGYSVVRGRVFDHQYCFSGLPKSRYLLKAIRDGYMPYMKPLEFLGAQSELQRDIKLNGFSVIDVQFLSGKSAFAAQTLVKSSIESSAIFDQIQVVAQPANAEMATLAGAAHFKWRHMANSGQLVVPFGPPFVCKLIFGGVELKSRYYQEMPDKIIFSLDDINIKSILSKASLVIVNGQTGLPVAKANVTSDNQLRPYEYCGNGKYSCSRVLPGKWGVRVDVGGKLAKLLFCHFKVGDNDLGEICIGRQHDINVVFCTDAERPGAIVVQVIALFAGCLDPRLGRDYSVCKLKGGPYYCGLPYSFAVQGSDEYLIRAYTDPKGKERPSGLVGFHHVAVNGSSDALSINLQLGQAVLVKIFPGDLHPDTYTVLRGDKVVWSSPYLFKYKKAYWPHWPCYLCGGHYTACLLKDGECIARRVFTVNASCGECMIVEIK